MDCLRPEIGRIGNQQRDRDFNRSIVYSTLEPVHRGGDDHSDTETAHDQVPKPQQPRCNGGRLISHRESQSKFNRQQPGCVIDETLAFEEICDPPRKADSCGNRGRGDRVGRCDHRAEDHAEAPVESWK